MISVNTVMAGAKSKPSERGQVVYRFHFVKRRAGKTLGFQRIPSRSDVEPKPARRFRGYKRHVVHPEEVQNLDETAKRYSQILKTR